MRNTIILYFRMIVVLFISVYSSRVVLKNLGVEDYGIYDVVGGIVSMFTVMTNTLSQASSRFISYSLGKKDDKFLKAVFSSSLRIQLVMAAIITLLSEIIGYWFLDFLNIPESRLFAAKWVLQCSIFTLAISLIKIPYQASIIAHECMSAFAFLSVSNAVLKLAAAFLIGFSFFDSLVLYGFLLGIASFLVFLYSVFFSIKHFKECRSLPVSNRIINKEIYQYASWNFVGSLSGVLQTQGVNILLNIFFGPVVNAARGVAVQVESAISELGKSVATSINPQIIKTYAADQIKEMHLLMCRSTKFVYFMLLFLSVPLFFEADFVLEIWLVEVPEHTALILRILLAGLLVDLSTNSLYIGIHATGKIREFVLLNSGIRLLILPLGYIALSYGCSPVSVFVIQILFWYLTQVPRIVIAHQLIKLPYTLFIKNSIFPIIKVTLLSLLCLFPISIVNQEKSWQSFIIICLTSVIVILLSIIFIGLTNNERNEIKCILRRIL